MEVTIGGERLGAGKKMKAYMHNYERSTHDLSYIFRSTMAAGTLVPFMSELALPGDTFDIDLNAECLTHPTIGPLFGSYKVQLDIFQVPLRLYQAQLHMNMLNIGRDMSNVKLPQVMVQHEGLNELLTFENSQISPSCILSYLGIRGAGFRSDNIEAEVSRNFNAIPYLGYWDIYKNYYANKQEEYGVVIHADLTGNSLTVNTADVTTKDGTTYSVTVNDPAPTAYTPQILASNIDVLTISGTAFTSDEDINAIRLIVKNQNGLILENVMLWEVFQNITIDVTTGVIRARNIWAGTNFQSISFGAVNSDSNAIQPNTPQKPRLYKFPLVGIDDMRIAILQHPAEYGNYIINQGTLIEPYGLPFSYALNTIGTGKLFAKQYGQEGLAVKTYNSDLFNNWISTEWIDGTDGISEITKIDTTSGGFTIDELNLSQKIYNMLNRIAISGGSYDDWLDAVYTHERTRSAENPMYLGGLIKELVFQEVISNAGSGDQPLGTLAGRGRLSDKHKGGHVITKIDEPSYLIGIVSLTPRVDYSQGNKWDMNLFTMNDLHKPAMDAIGFQDLITDQMGWWDTRVNNTGFPFTTNIFRSAGKQPAWINYMTNVNRTYGNFAEQTQQMFMTLNRRYGVNYDATLKWEIKDVTTYIDPSKFNHIFADTSLDAQNFWMQIGVKIEARRKISAKVIPNL